MIASDETLKANLSSHVSDSDDRPDQDTISVTNTANHSIAESCDKKSGYHLGGISLFFSNFRRKRRPSTTSSLGPAIPTPPELDIQKKPAQLDSEHQKNSMKEKHHAPSLVFLSPKARRKAAYARTASMAETLETVIGSSNSEDFLPYYSTTSAFQDPFENHAPDTISAGADHDDDFDQITVIRAFDTKCVSNVDKPLPPVKYTKTDSGLDLNSPFYHSLPHHQLVRIAMDSEDLDLIAAKYMYDVFNQVRNKPSTSTFRTADLFFGHLNDMPVDITNDSASVDNSVCYSNTKSSQMHRIHRQQFQKRRAALSSMEMETFVKEFAGSLLEFTETQRKNVAGRDLIEHQEERHDSYVHQTQRKRIWEAYNALKKAALIARLSRIKSWLSNSQKMDTRRVSPA